MVFLFNGFSRTNILQFFEKYPGKSVQGTDKNH